VTGPLDAIDRAILDGLRSLLASLPGELRSIVDEYVQSAERLLAEIDEALARGDGATAEMAAHSLKGVSGQMGARDVMAAARQVENACAAGDLEGARRAVPGLRAAHEVARPLLLEACDERTPGKPRRPAA